MDLRDILTDFLPLLLIVAFGLWPAFKKKLKKESDAFSSEKRDEDPWAAFSNNPDFPLPDFPVPVMPEPEIPPVFREKRQANKKNVVTPDKNKKKKQPKPQPKLPDEGIRAIPVSAAMKPIEDKPRATGARRELRKALVLGEILQRKY